MNLGTVTAHIRIRGRWRLDTAIMVARFWRQVGKPALAIAPMNRLLSGVSVEMKLLIGRCPKWATVADGLVMDDCGRLYPLRGPLVR